MQLPLPGVIPPIGVIYDSSMKRIDDALALALLYGLDGKRESRVVSLSISRPSLKAAAFCDAVARFYAGTAVQFMRMLPVGMETKGAAPDAEAMLDQPLAKPEHKHTVESVKDTADPAALIRNALTAHHDNNCLAVLSGPATNFLSALALPTVKELAAAKVRLLAIAPDETDTEGTNKLLAAWPGAVVVVSPEVGDQIHYPAASIESGFGWTPAHPIVDAYKAYKPMPYDAPTGALAAVMQAIRPKENYFKLSEPGTITMLAGGKIKHTPSADGKHRQVLVDLAQKERLVAAYTEIVSAKPVPRLPRFRPMPQEKKPDAPKPGEAKPSGG